MEEIFLKIALCDSDKQFEDIIGKYLVKIIEGTVRKQFQKIENKFP